MPGIDFSAEFSGFVSVWRCFLTLSVCVPLLYFIWKICAVLQDLGKNSSAKISFIKKEVLKPHVITIFCLWIAVLIYVFHYAYIWSLGAKVLPYSLFEIENSRRHPRIAIIPQDPLVARHGKDYAATCVSAAEYYAKKLGNESIIVDVYAFPPAGLNYGYEARLAQCVNDAADSLWVEPEVNKETRAVQNVTSLRLRINQLSTFLANDYRKKTGIAVLDTKALESKIADLTGCQLSEARQEDLSLVPVVSPLLGSIKATAPINPGREKILPQLNEIKSLAYSLYIRAGDVCFFMGHKIADSASVKNRKGLIDAWTHNLDVLEERIKGFKDKSQNLTEVPELFHEFLKGCSKGEENNIYLSRIYTIIGSE